MNDAIGLFGSARTVEGNSAASDTATRNFDVEIGLVDAPDRSFQSTLFQLEVVMSFGKITDPRVILQAMNLYMISNQQAQGIDLFSGLIARFGETMSAETLAIHESSLAMLRATYADRVPLLRRINWVKKSFDLLESAERRTQSAHPIPHWAAGLVYAQVPWFFQKKKAALHHLRWLADRPETEPVYGFYREVYRRLAEILAASGDHAESRRWRELSGYRDGGPHVPLMGWFTTGPEGTSMAPRPIVQEHVEGRVFALLGYGFSDIFFVLSEDKSALIAIDAGTTPQGLEAAQQHLLAQHPDLPPIKAAFITHAHWDHIGGHDYLRDTNPDIAIYGRSNFASVTDRVLREHSYHFFRGHDFEPDAVARYAPTNHVTAPDTVTIGGTAFSMIPVTGGETEDAMIIHIASLDCAFVGDIVMPWFGEPWVNEGFATRASDAIETVLELDASLLLHGHHPLTAMWNRAALVAYRPLLTWLVETTERFIRQGYSAKDIIRLNLVPQGLIDHPEATLAYVASRDNVIARVAHGMVGIWREDRTGQAPEGMDALTTVDRARMLSDYLGLSAKGSEQLLNRMIANGDHHMALQTAVAAELAYGATPAIIQAKERAADALRSGGQFLDPFGFTVLSEMTGRAHPPMGTSKTAEVRR